jgi:WD40 repeat protein
MTTFMVQGPVHDVSFAPDGERLAVVMAKGTVLVTDLTGRERLRIQLVHRRLLHGSAVFSPDGSQLVSVAPDNALHFWDSASGRLLRRLDQPHQVGKPVFSRDGSTLATADADGRVRLRAPGTGEVVEELPETTPPLVGVACSPDGVRLAVLGNGFADLHTVRGPAQWPLTITIPRKALLIEADFSPDGTRPATTQMYGGTTVWSTVTGAQAFQSAHKYANRIRFSPDGSLLATAGADKVWLSAAATGEALHTFTHRGLVNGLAFSPDGTMLATGGQSKRVQLTLLTG